MERLKTIWKEKRIEIHLISSLSFIFFVLATIKFQENELSINEFFVKGFILLVFLTSFVVNLYLYLKRKYV